MTHTSKCKVVMALSAAGTGVLIWYIYKKYFNTTVCRLDKRLYKDITNNNTIVAEQYSPEMHVEVRDKETSNKYSLKDLVKHSIGRYKRKVGRKPTGIVIGDEECYDVFREVIDPIVKRLNAMKCLPYRTFNHVRFKECEWKKIKRGRIVNQNVLSCVLTTSRNIAGWRFACSANDEERLKIAKEIVTVLNALPVYLRGDYTRLCNLTIRKQQKIGLYQDYGLTMTLGAIPLPGKPGNRPRLSHDNLALFEKWSTPDGRILWWTENRKHKGFVNFLDHIKLVISNTNGDLQGAARDYMELLAEFERILRREMHKEFAWSSKYGYLTSDLTDVGTGLHIEVKVKLKMVHKTEFFNRLMVSKELNCSQSDDERNPDTFIITNKNILGTTEICPKLKLSRDFLKGLAFLENGLLQQVDIIQQVVDGITLLLEIDKRLSRGEEIKDIMP